MSAGLMKPGRRTGSAMTSAVVLSVVISGLVLVGLNASVQRAFSASRLSNRMRAAAIAEGGANEAYSRLASNFELAKDPQNFPKTVYGGGTYKVGVQQPSANLAVIHATGVYQNASADVILEARRYTSGNGSGGGGADAGYGYVMLAGGLLDWRGDVDLNMGTSWMHANNTYYMNGSQRIKARVSACTSVSSDGGSIIDGTARSRLFLGQSPGNVLGGATVTNVPLVTIPDVDLTPYYNYALTQGQVFTGSKSISGTVTPNGGVMWVNGTLSISEGIYTGCFIATGDIELKTLGNGEIRQIKVAKYPAFVSRDGSILVKQAKNFTFDGLIYCKTGSFDKQGNGDVTARGQVIAKTNITKNGGWSAMIYENCKPVAPGASTNVVADVVSVEAWQK